LYKVERYIVLYLDVHMQHNDSLSQCT